MSPVCPEMSVGFVGMAGAQRLPTGHVFRVDRARGPIWYAKYRLPDGRQVQKKIGPAWTGRGRPRAGYVTKRLAEDWLRGVIDEARRGTLPGMMRTGATFCRRRRGVAAIRRAGPDAQPSTVATYRSLLGSRLLPAFAEMPIESITPGDDRVMDRHGGSHSGDSG